MDLKTGVPLIGANLILSEHTKQNNTIGTATNLNGEFEFNDLTKSQYQLTVSYIGYETLIKSIIFNTPDILELEIKLKEDGVLDVINLIGDQAEFRKTPVSLSNVKLDKIEKELAGQEIPMLLNSTQEYMQHSKEEVMEM